MSTVEVRISQLRDASSRLTHAASQLTQSVYVVRLLLDELAAGGLQSEAGVDFNIRYQNERIDMDTWSQQLRLFAEQLGTAADQIEEALSANQFAKDGTAINLNQTFSTGLMALGGAAMLEKNTHPPATQIRSALPQSLRDRNQPTIAAPKPVPTDEPELERVELDAYISLRNRPVFDELQRKENLILVSQNQLDGLLEQRADKISEIGALKNRLASFNTGIDVDTSPRVLALETQLEQINDDIRAVQDRMETLEGNINTLTERLGRVTPGPGANLETIFQLEGGTTSVWIRANTEGCVNHVVNQLPIPEGIAADAHLWDDNAAQLVEYGITTGDTPLQGSVLLMEPEHSYADDIAGHLMYVERVEDGVIWITDNDHATPIPLSDLTDEMTGDRLKYLYFPWHTRA